MAKSKIKNTIRHREKLIESLEKRQNAGSYLRTAIEKYDKDGNIGALLVALRNIAKARGGISELAKKIDISREHIYHVLSKKGNPKFHTFSLILKGLGYKILIQPDKTK